MKFVLVPRPALEIDRVRVGDGREIVTIAAVRAWLGLLPLLQGDLYFRDLRLEDAVGALSLDLPWSPPAAADVGSAAVPSPPATLDVERIELTGGDLVLRDHAGAEVLRGQEMDLVFSLDGRDRFRLAGDLVLGGRAISLDARLGAQGGDGVRAISISGRAPGALTVLSLNGRISLTRRTFVGEVGIRGEQGAALLSNFALPVRETPALARAIALTAKVSADETGIALSDIVFDAGGTAAKGAIEWRSTRAPQLTVSMDFAPFALEDWRVAAAAVPAIQGGAATVSTPPPEATRSSLTADIALRFPALSYRGQGLRDGAVRASLANGELKISDVSAVLPGATRLQGIGLVRLGDASPVVDGIVTLTTFDARGLLSWLGADVSGVPPGRFGAASFQGALQGSPTLLELNDIEASLDTTRINGRLSFAPRTRPFFGVDLRIDNVNLDSYRSASREPEPIRAQSPPTSKPDVYGVTPSGTAFAGLGSFDAELHVEMNGVTAGGIPGGRIGLDLGLKDGALDVRTASLEKVAGTTAWFSGAVSGFGAAVRFDDFQFDIAGDDVARLAALMRVAPGSTLKSLGAASLTGRLNGGALQADITANLKAAGLTARATGYLLEVDKNPRFDGVIEAAHPRYSELMRTASYPWPTSARDPGSLELAARVVQDAAKTTIRDLRVAVGKDRMTGEIEFTKVEGRTQLTARLSNILLDLDRVLPPREVGASVRANAREKTALGPASLWSQEPFSWAFLKGWNGEISVAGPGFAARGVAFQDFSARIVVADDVAELADWQGKIFGAPGQLSVRLAAVPEPSLQAQLAVNRADFRSVVAALNGGRTNVRSSGTADLALGFSTRGTSAAAFASALSGTVTANISAAESGSGLSAGLLGPLSAAAQLDVGTPGMPAPVAFSMRMSAVGGLIKLESAQVSSRGHTGSFEGTISLPRRQVDVKGTLVPRETGKEPLPIAITGAMDRPNIRLLPPPRS